jgi:hypothetical protein
MRMVLLRLILGAGVLLACRDVRASGERIGILRFTGWAAEAIQQEAIRVVSQHGYSVVGPDEIDYVHEKFGVRLDSKQGVATLAEVRELHAVLIGRVTGTKRRRVVTIDVRRGRDGARVGRLTWSGRGSEITIARLVGRTLWPKLRPKLPRPAPRMVSSSPAQAATAPNVPAAVDAPTPVEETRPVEQAAPDREATPTAEATPAPPIRTPPPSTDDPLGVAASATVPESPARPATLELVFGPRFFSRRFTYRSDPSATLRDYQTRSFAPALGVAALWFPKIPEQPWRAYVGLALGIEHGLSLESKTRDGSTFQSPNRDYHLSMLVRVPFQHADIDLFLGGGQHLFAFVAQGSARTGPALVPDVTYLYARTGAHGRFHLGSSVDFLAGVAYRHVVDAGEISSSEWFPFITVRGFDATAGFALRLMPRWEARFQVDLRRYAQQMNSLATDPSPSLGAVDQLWSFWAGAAMRFGKGAR